MYSEKNKEINNYRNLVLQFSQPAEIHSSLRLPLEYSKSEGLLSSAFLSRDMASYMFTIAKISLIYIVTPRFHRYEDVTATYIRRSEEAPTYIR